MIRLSIAFCVIMSLPLWTQAADTTALNSKIDAHLRKSWELAGVKPSPKVDDHAFLRRVSLDLLGRIPTSAEVAHFEKDRRSDKRNRLVESMLGRPEHARHWATFWRKSWLPQTEEGAFVLLADDFEEWLRERIQRNDSYDQWVRQTLSMPASPIPVAGAAKPIATTSPRAFWSANENKPENLAAGAVRAFLGVNLDCAQCHNHPFARWTRDQFWQTAAFFARVPPEKQTANARPEILIPGTTRTVSATLMNDEKLPWQGTLNSDTGRQLLAGWMVTKENPFFARNAVNRVWANLFGTGLVEPLDDLSDSNPASHPELLAELAKSFADSNFDVKRLIAAIVSSEAYQAGSETVAGQAPVDRRMFGSMPVRGLTGEQLYVSLRTATGLAVERDDLDPVNAHAERKQFSKRFRIDRPVGAQRSILQSLTLMNGELTARITHPEKSPLIVSIADSPFLDTPGRIEMLFVSTLGRKPDADEVRTVTAHLETARNTLDERKKLSDVLWAILNSGEFNTNH